MVSILTSVKKLLGIEEEYDHFDSDIIIHINSVFFILNQIGVGPLAGFSISDKTKTWDEYIPDSSNLEAIKSYMYLKVRLIFDPPTSTSLIEAMKAQANEFEWRIMSSVTPIITKEETYNGEN